MTAVGHTLRMATIAQQFDDADDAADSRNSLRDARKRIADLETEKRANVATIRQLQTALSDARNTLADRDLELGSLRDDLANALTALRGGVAA